MKIKKSRLKMKRPENPYIRYCGEKFPLVKAENPDMGMIEINKVLAQRWKNAVKGPFQ